MSPELRSAIYRSADVLVELPYLDSMTCLIEASAFGVPAVATRIHHGEDFVREGVNGYLVDPPLYAYSEGYGSRWRLLSDFMADVQGMREEGRLRGVVDQVDRLDVMLSEYDQLDDLRAGARRLHAERFAPGVRNARLNGINARARPMRAPAVNRGKWCLKAPPTSLVSKSEARLAWRRLRCPLAPTSPVVCTPS